MVTPPPILAGFVTDTVEAFVSALVAAISGMFDALLDVVAQLLCPYFDTLLEALPTYEFGAAWNATVPYLSGANYYFPVVETLALTTAYFSFKVVLAVVRFVLKIIPWIG